MYSKLFISCLLLLSSLYSQGQEISKSQIIPTGGFSKNDSGVSIDWMIGEVVNLTTTGTSKNSNSVFKPIVNKESLPTNQTPQNRLSNNPRLQVKLKQINVEFFPNPTHERLFIKFKEVITTSIQTKIFDSMGILLHEQTINIHDGNLIEIRESHQLPAGAYIILLQNENEIIHQETVIKI